MELGFLRDTVFRVYRTNQLPTLSVSHKDLITSLVAKYLYTKYKNSNNDLIPRFKSANDVKVNTVIESSELQQFTFLHISIEHGPSTQTVVFIQKNDKFISFIRLPLPLFLVEVLESLDLENPLALEQCSLTSEFITTCVNGLNTDDPSAFGQIDLSFLPKKALTGNSLKEIKISFPREDSNKILRKKDKPLDCLYDWLEKTTTLKFRNLDLSSLSCSIIAIKSNTVSILCPLVPETQVVGLLTTIIESVYI